jgi:hypothetical protein
MDNGSDARDKKQKQGQTQWQSGNHDRGSSRSMQLPVLHTPMGFSDFEAMFVQAECAMGKSCYDIRCQHVRFDNKK